MTELFRTVLNMSITGAYIAAVIIIIRLFMKKLPKRFSYFLWIILGIRLLCPFSFSSAVSLFNVIVPEKTEVSSGRMEYIPQELYSTEAEPADENAVLILPKEGDPVYTPVPSQENKPEVTPMQICAAVWAVGAAAMLLYTAFSFVRVKKLVRGAKHKEENIYTCESIETPFVFGIIKPRIYLPENLSDDDTRYIIAHEKAHISRGDHIAKLAAMLALCIHWFNPTVWLSFRLMTRDMELSCDEKALGSFDTDVKKAYANALLNISAQQNRLGVLGFGESDIKSRIKGVLSAKKPKLVVTVVAAIAVIAAAVCLLTNADKKSSPVSIPDGVYIADVPLFISSLSSSSNGYGSDYVYEFKGNSLKMYNVLRYGSDRTYTLSEFTEIPFSQEEWSEEFGSVGRGDSEIALGTHSSEYCTVLSPEDGSYLFVMDNELWYVSMGWEIIPLKEAGDLLPDRSYNYLSRVTDLDTALDFKHITGKGALSLFLFVPYNAAADEDSVQISDKTLMRVSPFVKFPVDAQSVRDHCENEIKAKGFNFTVISHSRYGSVSCNEYEINDGNNTRWFCFIKDYTEGGSIYSNIIIFETTDEAFTYEAAKNILETAVLFDSSVAEEDIPEDVIDEPVLDTEDEFNYMQPVDAAREYLNEKNVKDSDIAELRIMQSSFFNEAWKYTVPPLSENYGVSEDANVVEVVASYTKDGGEVMSYIIVCVDSNGFRVLDEVKYNPKEFTATVEKAVGNEQVTGYEWQEYVVIPDEDASLIFEAGVPVTVYSLPSYGNDFFKEGDRVEVRYNDFPETALLISSDMSGYFAHFVHLDLSSDNTETVFRRENLTRQESFPDENGDFHTAQDSPSVSVRFAVPEGWTGDGYGEYELDGNTIMSQRIVYPDSYGLEVSADGFKTDMAMGREVTVIDEKYGAEGDAWAYYIHTIIESYYGDIDYHHFIVHQNGYYADFNFPNSEDFSMEAAEAVIETVQIEPVSSEGNGGFRKERLSQRESYPDEYGFTSDKDYAVIDVEFTVPESWTGDGNGLYAVGEKRVMQQYVVYPDSYGIYTDDFKRDIVSGREIIIDDEEYGGENDVWSYYIHTKMEDGEDYVFESYDFIVHRNGYYAIFSFDANEYFSMETAEAILESVNIYPQDEAEG